MKQIVIAFVVIIGLVIGALLLSNIVHKSEPSETVAAEIQFVNFVRQNGSTGLARTDREILLDYANATCEALEVGISADSLVNLALDQGLSSKDAGLLVESAVRYICPEHSTVVGNRFA